MSIMATALEAWTDQTLMNAAARAGDDGYAAGQADALAAVQRLGALLVSARQREAALAAENARLREELTGVYVELAHANRARRH